MTSGFRTGTAAPTPRGMRTAERPPIGEWIRPAPDQPDDRPFALEDGARARALTPRAGGLGETATEGLAGGVAGFVAGGVVGDERDIRQPFGDRTHLQALAGVSLAATAEYADQTTLRVFAQRRQ